MGNPNSFFSGDQLTTVGTVLRARREQLGWSLDEVSKRLRIRQEFLNALEEGQIDKLPGIVYASGFLRAYAELLNLNTDEILQRFKSENQQVDQKPDLLFPMPVAQRGISLGVIILISAVIIVIAYIGWYKKTNHEKTLSETIPPVVIESGKNINKIKTSPQIASVMPTDRPTPLPQEQQDDGKDISQGVHSENEPENTKTGKDESLPSSDDNFSSLSGQSTQTNSQPTTTVTSTEANKVSSDGKNDSNLVPSDAQGQIIVKATAPSWMRIQKPNGKVLYEHTLQTGESWTLPIGEEGALMTVGNAGGIVIEWQGKLSSPLGKQGTVIRKFVMSKDNVGKLFSDQNPPSASDNAAINNNSIATPAGSNRRSLNNNAILPNVNKDKIPASDNP
ncbi:MAG: helix-turn-helix domain-containing protein [Commensalibacter sp.]